MQKCYNRFVEITCFELQTVLRHFLGIIVKNAKHIKGALGIYLHFCNQSKNLSVAIWVLKICFPKIYIFGHRPIPGPQPDTASYIVPSLDYSTVYEGGHYASYITI